LARLGMVYMVARWEEKAILRAARDRGVEMEAIHLPSLRLTIGQAERELPEVVLQRSISHYAALSSTLVLESLGVRVVNTSSSTAAANDKIWSAALLSKAGVAMPRTGVAWSMDAAISLAREMGYPVVVKPSNGSWGRMVALADDEEDLRAILEHREYMPQPEMKVHMLQEYVPKPGRDIRVTVVGGRPVAGIYRYSEHWITNTARGGRAEPAPVEGELGEVAARAAEAVGLEIAGVDVFEHPEKGYLVNEVNPVPEFKNTVRVTGVDVAGEMVEYLLGLARR
jgi:[lysine-biosynthesis-protein LysW]--L-2-aminoadipate ligase